MAIQNRRGQYADFDPSKAVAGELLTVLNGDPKAKDGKAVYMAFASGDVKRLATYEDMLDNIENASEEIAEQITEEIEEGVADSVQAAQTAATTATTKASEAAASAASVSASASQIATNTSDISDLKSALTKLSETRITSNNILKPTSESGYYDATTGAKKRDSGYIRTVDATELPSGWTQINLIARSQLSGSISVCFYSGENTDTFISRVGVASLTITTVNIPTNAHYVRLSMPNSNSFVDVSICKTGITTYDAYQTDEFVKNSAMKDLDGNNFTAEVNSDIQEGTLVYDEFEIKNTGKNILPPSQESGLYTATVGQAVIKTNGATYVRTPSPIPFASFTGEFRIYLKNLISGGGYVQIIFLANDQSTVVAAKSLNGGTTLSLIDFAPATAKYFVMWASKGDSDFSIADILVANNGWTYQYEAYNEQLVIKDAASSVLSSDISKNFYAGKNIVIFGDSIFGMVDDDTSTAAIMRGFVGANIYNCAFGGTRLSIRTGTTGYEEFDFGNLVDCVVDGDFSPLTTAISSYSLPTYYTGRVNRLSAIDFSKVDIVLLYYGTNDYMSGVTKAQVLACADYIKVLQARYPQIKVYYCSPAYRVYFDGNNQFEYDSNTYNPSQGTLVDYVEWYEEMSDNINIPFIDCYKIGINSANYSQYFTAPDGVHHNANGRALLGEHIARCVMSK